MIPIKSRVRYDTENICVGYDIDTDNNRVRQDTDTDKNRGRHDTIPTTIRFDTTSIAGKKTDNDKISIFDACQRGRREGKHVRARQNYRTLDISIPRSGSIRYPPLLLTRVALCLGQFHTNIFSLMIYLFRADR